MRRIFLVFLLLFTGGMGLWTAAAPFFNLTVRRDPQVEKIVAAVSAESIRQSVKALVGFHSRHSASAQDHPTRGTGAAARWIRSRFEEYGRAAGGRLKVEFDAFDQTMPRMNDRTLRFVNVVARLPGRRPERMLVVAGHYDSLAFGVEPDDFQPGANDDASGTAAVLELARVMSPHEFDATLVFIAFAGEEVGLVGSRHWARQARDKGWRIEAMITNDIIGNIEGGNGVIDNNSLRVFSEGPPAGPSPATSEGPPAGEDADPPPARRTAASEVDSPSRQLARYIKEKGEAYLPNFTVRLIYRRDRFGRGGDHVPFNEAGYAAVRLTEANEDYRRQHQRVREEQGIRYGDLPDKVSYPYAAQVTRVNAAALASLALAPAPPEPVSISGGGRYDTTLRWPVPDDPRVAGYNVLLRETDAPVWQRKLFYPKASLDVQDGTATVVLKNVVIDNYFFAVQAVDGRGNESLPVFPRPAPRRRTR